MEDDNESYSASDHGDAPVSELEAERLRRAAERKAREAGF